MRGSTSIGFSAATFGPKKSRLPSTVAKSHWDSSPTGSYESAICRAEQQRSLRKGKLVIPVKAQRDCDVPLFLEILQYIDFSNLAHYAQSLDQLHESITHRRGIVALPNIQPAYNNSPRPSPTTSSTAPISSAPSATPS